MHNLINKNSLSKRGLKGTLENAGLGEFSFYLKKASQYAQYANFSLENTDFESIKDENAALLAKIASLRKMAEEIIYTIDQLPVSACEALEKYEQEKADSDQGHKE